MTKRTERRPGYKHTPLGWIPNEWEITEFDQIARVSKEKYSPNDSESRRCIELEHIEQQTGQILGTTDSAIQKSTKNVFYRGQVLFGKLRPYLRKYWLADFDGFAQAKYGF